MTEDRLYHIVHIGPYAFLFKPQKLFNTYYKDIRLWVLEGENLEVNILVTRGSMNGFFAFGHSPALQQILSDKGVEIKKLAIVSADSNLRRMELEGGIDFNIFEKTREAYTFYTYLANKTVPEVPHIKREIFESNFEFPLEKYISHVVSIVFSGPADPDGKAPSEVRNFMVEVSDQKFKSGLKSVIAFVLVFVLMAWLLIRC